MKNKCHYCESEKKEMRPYGPGGAWVCFDCAMATDERKAEAERQLARRFDAAERGGGPVVIGGRLGPEPLRGRGRL